jgi:DNA-binding NarL/FixJ family response regulator
MKSDTLEQLREKLTAREWSIATALAEGLSYQEIAEKFNISFHTVASHVKSILAKSGQTSSRKLAALIRRVRE